MQPTFDEVFNKFADLGEKEIHQNEPEKNADDYD